MADDVATVVAGPGGGYLPAGGAGGFGNIYTLTQDGTLTLVYSFTGGNDGGGPIRLLQTSDGAIYGTTWLIDDTNRGTEPSGLLQASDGMFYGTTASGGSTAGVIYNDGIFFSMAPGGVLTPLYSQMGGQLIGGLMRVNDGNFVGLTSGG